jgi:uncharacterized protein YcbK (DUF882 family)
MLFPPTATIRQPDQLISSLPSETMSIPQQPSTALSPSRRGERVLQLKKLSVWVCLSLLVLSAAPSVSPANTAAALVPEYRLRLYHLHTNERIDLIYRRGNRYDSGSLEKLNTFLRDHRTGDMHAFDPRLFDLLHDLTGAAGHVQTEIQIICGYRSPGSNEFLRRTSSGVASRSLHMEGEAIDIRIPGVSTAALRDAALRLGRGGVGFYDASQFVHVDVGRVRKW